MTQTIASTAIARFWNMVAKPTPAGCWTWLGGTHARGYGRTRWRGEPEQTHRIAWQLTNGPIEPGHEIVQTCGNKLCCNPGHMVSQLDKQQSKAALQRQRDRIQKTIDQLEERKIQIDLQIHDIFG